MTLLQSKEALVWITGLIQVAVRISFQVVLVAKGYGVASNWRIDCVFNLLDF